MKKGELKLWHFVIYLLICMIVFAAIFAYIKYYSQQDSIVNFVPEETVYYLHVDINGHNNVGRNEVAKKIISDLDFNAVEIQKIFSAVGQEIAIAYIGQAPDQEKLLFLRSKKVDELVNFLEEIKKPYKKISSRLIVLADKKIDREFKAKKNNLFAEMNQIRFSGNIFYWGFVKQQLLVDEFSSTGKLFGENMDGQLNEDDYFVFTSYKEQEKVRFRLGRLLEMSSGDSFADLSNGNQVNGSTTLLVEPSPDSNIVILLDDITFLNDYFAHEQVITLIEDIITELDTKSGLFSTTATNKIQLNFKKDAEEKYYQLILAVDEDKSIEGLEEIIKNRLAFYFPREELLVLPDESSAKQLVGRPDEIIREERMVNEQKIITLKTADGNFALAFTYYDDKLFIGNSSEELGNIIFRNLPEEVSQPGLKKVLDQCLNVFRGSIVYVHGQKYQKEIATSIFSMDFENLMLSTTKWRNFQGIEGCFY